MNEQYVSSQAVNQNSAIDPEQLKQSVVQDIKQIENLVQNGVMTQDQGQNLMNYITQRAFIKYTSQAPQAIQPAKLTVASEFFNRDGRMDVLDYLKNSNVDFDDDEISKITALVEKIENTAVERYLKEKEHEKTLNSENESAKLRLRANAQNAVSDGAKNLVFTRDQIGKMSGAEFAKHEKAIMEQLRKGLIK